MRFNLIGQVRIGNTTIEVKYHFIDEDTIECLESDGNVFFTSYESLID